MAFLETPKFPTEISEGASGGPMFKTQVFDMNEGLEQRHTMWTRGKHRYDIGLGIRHQDDMALVRSFFIAVQGRKNSFRYRDWNDYELDGEVIGTGDGVKVLFSITKTYVTGAYSYVRDIAKPVAGLQVFVDAVLQVETTDYAINLTTGLVTFVAAPGNALVITVTGEFDMPVRFDTDIMEASHRGYESEDWGSITLVEDLTA